MTGKPRSVDVDSLRKRLKSLADADGTVSIDRVRDALPPDLVDRRDLPEWCRLLESEGIVSDGSIRDTPLAFLLGVYATPEEAAQRVRELGSRGIPAYALGAGPVRVWAGAFQNEGESRLLASALGAEEAARLSRRER